MEQLNVTTEIVIVPIGQRTATGKLASAEIRFSGGLMDGLRLVGFGIWKKSAGGENVTFPMRQYLVNREPHKFSLLQSLRSDGSLDRLHQAILAEYRSTRVISETDDPEFPDLPRP